MKPRQPKKPSQLSEPCQPHLTSYALAAGAAGVGAGVSYLDDVLLTGYAYETIANKTIVAGRKVVRTMPQTSLPPNRTLQLQAPAPDSSPGGCGHGCLAQGISISASQRY